ncbi:diaminopimelate decarboxylase [Fibrobacter sp. UWB16]|uniref:pyridoxal-dependent decarboxylase n=1 Tax=Fibrobacter sp. UWB16 TaxID=1945874 RepID=UPI000BD821AB|nr:pyridoxal-dependent decarboxylase [Fibrobacter sp. UWB16]SOD11553.1 diaminopimelate decarboxylase [Fibrobacter sp. UWB16]
MNCLQTPYFLINKDFLDDELLKLKNALQSSWGNYIIGYSYKTNAFPWVINYFKKNGCYAEVVSDDEYNLAKSIGANKIIYNGIAKSKETFIEAVKNNSIVNIDSEYEIDWLDELEKGRYSVGIRVNFDLESKCPGQTQCGEDGERFGFCYENGELKRAIDKIQAKGIKISGLHLHKSSKTRLPDIYKAIADAAVEITDKYELNLDYVDIGGGFFGGLASKPQFIEYFSTVSAILRRNFNPKKTVLVVEPGMALIGAAVDYYTTVKDVKKTIRNMFVVTDGSRTQIDPLMTKSSYFKDIVRNGNEKRTELNRQIICGFTCMEHDRMFEVKNEQELLPNDQIIYHKVGAYTMCLSPLFIKWFPSVYVKDGPKISKVRDKWTDIEYKSRTIGDEK